MLNLGFLGKNLKSKKISSMIKKDINSKNKNRNMARKKIEYSPFVIPKEPDLT
jgi:hypothetical protein